MRNGQQLSLKDFWGKVGYTISRGSAYETGRTELPEHARRLIYLEYVAGIPTDIDSERFHQFETALKSISQVQKMQAAIAAIQSTMASANHD